MLNLKNQKMPHKETPGTIRELFQGISSGVEVLQVLAAEWLAPQETLPAVSCALARVPDTPHLGSKQAVSVGNDATGMMTPIRFRPL